MPRSPDTAPPAIRKSPRPTLLSLEALENRDCPNTYTVTSTSDDGSVGTLRWAVAQANTNMGDDTIDFAGTAHSITLGGTQLELTDITGTTTIAGTGMTVSGGGLSRVFQVGAGASASFLGLTITGGSLTGNGAGLFNLGTTALTGCTVTGNHAIGVSGSVTSGLGGGVANDSGILELTACTISDNTADLAGGGVANKGTLGVGGGKGSSGTPDDPGQVTMTACNVTGNAAGGAGGVLSGVPLISGSGKSATVTLGPTDLSMQNCAVSNNLALGADGTLGDALAGASGFGVVNVSTATLTNSTISGNDGGGVLNLGIGVGKSSSTTATLNMTDCTVKANLASDPAVGGSISDSGFGVANLSIATLTNTTISGNESGGVFTGVSGSGKGSTHPVLEMINCTVTQHLATTGVSDTGYGVVNTGGAAALTNSTISGNDGGVDSMSTTTLLNTIVAGNTTADLSGTGYSGSNNLIGTDASAELMDGVNGNIVGVAASDLHLAALGDNGGATQTMALLPGSPAINKGASVTLTTLTAPIADTVATSITVASTKGLGIGLYVQIDGEILRITCVTDATTLTVARGQLGTPAAAHSTIPTDVTLASDQRGLAPYTGGLDIGAFDFVPGAVGVTVSPSSTVEGGATTLTYTFTRTSSTAGALVVKFTVAGTAAFTDDYTASSLDAGFTFDGTNGTVTFAAGNATATVVLTPVNDALVEGTETVDLTVAPGTDYDVGTPSAASGTIADNDTATLSITATSTVTEQGGAQTITVTLTTSDGAGGTATLAPGVTLTADVVDLFTGTADSGTDYSVFGTQQVSFGPGSGDGTTQTVTLTPMDDALFEHDETVNLRLQNLTPALDGQAALGNVSSVVTITDDDPAPGVSLSLARGKIAEASGKATVTATLSGKSGLPVTVFLGFAGTAKRGTDYTASQMMITIPAGSLTGSVTLTSIPDRVDEPNETIVVKIASATNATSAAPKSVTATILDDDNSLFAVAQATGGAVNLYTGDGTLVRSFAPFPGWTGELRVATGDVTGDGFEDVVVGAGANAHVKVFDGLSGALVRSFLAFPGFGGGVTVAAGDTDGDGLADIIVGAGSGAPGGHVKVFSGLNNALLQSFLAFPGFSGGVSVAAGDVDGDRRADVVVLTGAGSTPHVKVFSGQNNALLRSFLAPDGTDPLPSLTAATVAAGDVNGDGLAELMVGSARSGAVRVYGGPAGGQVAGFDAFPGFAGGVRVGATDRNGDGLAEIVVGVGPGGPGGHVKIFDGLSLSLVSSFLSFPPSIAGGVYVG